MEVNRRHLSISVAGGGLCFVKVGCADKKGLDKPMASEDLTDRVQSDRLLVFDCAAPYPIP